jgi:PIN domain nuclease of toxin-antitoxin system
MPDPVVVVAASPVLLETCTAIWLMGKTPISDKSRKAIRLARVSGSGVYVSVFCAWEIGMLVAKGKIQLTKTPADWLDELLAQPRVRLAALTTRILLSSTALPGNPPADPADRIVVATARAHGYTVVTRDREILDYANQGHIQAIES